MADRPIQVGDLVIVIREYDCLCKSTGIGIDKEREMVLGHIFRVGKIWRGVRCYACGIGTEDLAYQPSDGRWVAAPRSILKRIDPDCLKDDEPTREELTA